MTMIDVYYCLHCDHCKEVHVDWDDLHRVTRILCNQNGPVDEEQVKHGCQYYAPRKCCASCRWVRHTANHEGGDCGIDEYGIFKIMTNDKSLLINTCERWEE